MSFGIKQTVFELVNNGDQASLASRMRASRFALFSSMLKNVQAEVRILDLGGTSVIWQRNYRDLPPIQVTLLNRHFEDTPSLPYLSYAIGDARDLSRYPDRHFHICFSNSLIEHAGSWQDQQALAREISRVAAGYFVQTPYRYFPVEPHFLVPGWQFLPSSLRAWLLQRRNWGWVDREPDHAKAREAVESIRLLDAQQLESLFPGCRIHRELFGPITKSLIAIRPITTPEAGISL